MVEVTANLNTGLRNTNSLDTDRRYAYIQLPFCLNVKELGSFK